MKNLTPLLTILFLTACSGGNSSSSGSGGASPQSTGIGVDKSICSQTHGLTWEQFKNKHQNYHNRPDIGWEDSPATAKWHKENGTASCFPNRPVRSFDNPIGTHT